MSAVRVVLVEDEPLALRRLREFAQELTWLTIVGESSDGQSAIAMIDDLQPDLVFLDVQLPEVTGLEVLDRIQHEPAVIFTTAYNEYAVSAFELEALDYLVKPFGRERFQAAAERARKVLLSAEDDEPASAAVAPRDRAREALKSSTAAGPMSRIFVRHRGKIVQVPVREIERLEAEDDYVAVFARGQRHLVYLTLNEFEQRLDPERFVRIHRSHMVNLDYVSSLAQYDATRLQVEMRDGAKVLASRARSRELRGLVL